MPAGRIAHICLEKTFKPGCSSVDQKYTAFYTGENSKQGEPTSVRAKKRGQVAGLVLFFSADADIASGQGVTCNFKVQRPFFAMGSFSNLYISILYLYLYIFIYRVSTLLPRQRTWPGLHFR